MRLMLLRDNLIVSATAAWVGLLFLLYSFYHGLLTAVALIGGISLFTFYLLKKIVSGKTVKSLLLSIARLKFSSGYAAIFFAFPVLAALLANIAIILLALAQGTFRDFIENFIYHESSICWKIFSLWFFYGLILLLTQIWGRKIMRIFMIPASSRLEFFLFSAGLGFLPLIFGTLALGLAGFLYGYTVGIMALAFTAVSFGEIKQIYGEVRGKKFIFSLAEPGARDRSLAVAGLYALALFCFIAVMKPAPHVQSLQTSFNVPNLYVAYHEIKPLGGFAANNMGQNGEMIYAAILALASPAYIVHFSLLFFLLSLAAAFGLCRRIFGEQHALLALALLTFIPWNATFLYENKVDFILAFYSLLMLYAFVLWRENTKYQSWLFLLGVFAGVAMSIKYNAALLILPVFAWAVIIAAAGRKRSIVSAAKPLLASVFLAILFFSPWMIRNQIHFKNILFPFSLSTLITGEIRTNGSYEDPFGDSARARLYAAARNREVVFLKHGRDVDNALPADWLRTAWNVSLGRNVVLYNNGNFGFAPILVLPLYLLFLKDRRIVFSLSVLTAYFLLWLVLPGGARPWYAFCGVMLSYALLPYLLLKNKKILVFYAFVLFLFAHSLISNLIIGLNANLPYIAGYLNKEQYLSRNIGLYDMGNYINDLCLGPRDRILVVGSFMIGYINRNDELVYLDPYLGRSGYYLNQGSDIFREKLAAASVSYILYPNYNEHYYDGWLENKNMSPDAYLSGYDASVPSIYEDRAALNKFIAGNAAVAARSPKYTLYQIK